MHIIKKQTALPLEGLKLLQRVRKKIWNTFAQVSLPGLPGLLV
jgi:hypothetical protein